jgi:hypothetical protein
VPLASGSRSRHPLACVGIALSSSSAEFSERLGHERVGHEHTRKPGMTVSPGGDSAQDRAAVILTPDQRVRVFISSTLEELAEERAAALRAIRRLHLVPVWFKSGVRPHPPQSMDRAYLEQSQIWIKPRKKTASKFRGHLLAAVWLGGSRAWRSRVWRMSSGWPLASRCCCT